MIIVLIAHGKGSSDPHNFAVKLFDSETDAKEYCDKVTDTESKYYTVAEIVESGEGIEPSIEGFYPSYSSDWF